MSIPPDITCEWISWSLEIRNGTMHYWTNVFHPLPCSKIAFVLLWISANTWQKKSFTDLALTGKCAHIYTSCEWSSFLAFREPVILAGWVREQFENREWVDRERMAAMLKACGPLGLLLLHNGFLLCHREAWLHTDRQPHRGDGYRKWQLEQVWWLSSSNRASLGSLAGSKGHV